MSYCTSWVEFVLLLASSDQRIRTLLDEVLNNLFGFGAGEGDETVHAEVGITFRRVEVEGWAGRNADL